MTTISSGSIPHDATLLLRAIIASGTVDPISATRSAKSSFVVTSYPTREVEYPIISVLCSPAGTEPLGSNTESFEMGLDFEVRVWARNEVEKDGLLGQVIHQLRTSQKGTTPISGTESCGLYDMTIGSTANVPEPGIVGVKSAVLPVSYKFQAVD